jgi:hypothetical protein
MKTPKVKNFSHEPLPGAIKPYLRIVRDSFMRPLLSVALLFTFATLALGQSSGSATLRGRVTDPAGAVVADLGVTLTNEATKDERKTKTNDDGFYLFSAVSPGTYTVRVEGSGFKTSEQKGVILSPSDTRGLDIAMEIGQTSETVTVQATGERLQTETGAKENTLTAKQIDNLSIISRSSLELLRILPGVVAPDQDQLESISFGGGANANSAYHVNGLRGEQNTVTVDGSRMMDIGSNNGTIITANPDMVQEVKVQTSNYAAEHGTSAVQISATTKGGSSAFHGSLYDYIRDSRFGANDRSNSINGIAKPKSKYNYPGGNIGGPVVIPGTKFNSNRDKLFFFVGFEYYYQRVDEGSSLSVTPTLKQRQGDFSELLTGPGSNLNQGRTINVPAGCTVGGVGGNNPAPNNNIAPCADPLGKALLNMFPAPNFTDPNNRFNYVYSVLRPNDRNQLVSRIDYSISDKTKLYVRLAREYEKQGFPRGLWWDSANYEIPGQLQSKNLGRSFVVNLTNIVSPTMTNEVLFSASKLKLNYDFADPDKVSYAALGLEKVGYFPGSNPYVPIGVIDAWGGGIGGNLLTAYGYPILAWNDSFAITDNLTKVYNTHTMKFGTFIEQANKKQQSNHDTNITLAQWGQSNGTLNNYGDLFVGRPIQFTQATDRPIDHFRYYNYEFYGQDSWKVRPNFTLEYGLRMAYLPNNFERKGLGVLFDPREYDPSQGIFLNGDRTRPNGFLLASRDEIPKGVLPNPGVVWMPRLNFAWDVGSKGDLVVRAGAGIFYNRVQGNYDYYSSGQMPNTYSATVDTPWASATGLTFSDLKNVDPFAAIANVNVQSRDISSNDIPRVANMSLTIEKRLPWNNLFTVAYVSTQGRHLPQQRSINIVPVGRLLSGTVQGSDLSNPVNRAALNTAALKQFKPYSAFNNVNVFQFTGTSTYHSLQATLSHQSGKNLQYFATYTFGKALGTVATNESDGAAFADPIDTRGRSWGVLPFDRTHVFNLSYNYNLPKLARGMLNHVVGRGFLDGWQMSGITTFQSGNPIRLRFSGDIAGTGQAIAWYGTDAFNAQGQSVGAITPVYLRNPKQSNGTGVGDKLLDIGAFQIPSFGDSGPHQPPFYIRTPSRSNFDLSLFKNFVISESQKFQFRAGFFNLFNQAYPVRISVTDPNASDIYLNLNTTCNRRVATAPDGVGGNTTNFCDPTGGFSFTPETIERFGKITNKHGRRIIEFALKYYF